MRRSAPARFGMRLGRPYGKGGIVGWQHSLCLSMCECGGLGLLWGNGAEVGSGKAGGVGEQVGVQAVVYPGCIWVG